MGWFIIAKLAAVADRIDRFELWLLEHAVCRLRGHSRTISNGYGRLVCERCSRTAAPAVRYDQVHGRTYAFVSPPPHEQLDVDCPRDYVYRGSRGLPQLDPRVIVLDDLDRGPMTEEQQRFLDAYYELHKDKFTQWADPSLVMRGIQGLDLSRPSSRVVRRYCCNFCEKVFQSPETLEGHECLNSTSK